MILTDLNDDLGKRIRERRDGLQLTQREAAKRLGVSERTLQNWEAGAAFPRRRHLRALDRFLADEIAA